MSGGGVVEKTREFESQGSREEQPSRSTEKKRVKHKVGSERLENFLARAESLELRKRKRAATRLAATVPLKPQNRGEDA